MAEEIDSIDEVDPDEWIVGCIDCAKLWKTDEAGTIGSTIAAEHRRHTGHETRAARPSWYDDDDERVEWWVNCNTCKKTPDFRDEAIARRYFEQHEAHIGHKADSIEREVFEVK
jgi:hypothetical protein